MVYKRWVPLRQVVPTTRPVFSSLSRLPGTETADPLHDGGFRAKTTTLAAPTPITLHLGVEDTESGQVMPGMLAGPKRPVSLNAGSPNLFLIEVLLHHALGSLR